MRTAEMIVNGSLWGAMAIAGLVVYVHESDQMVTAHAVVDNPSLLHDVCVRHSVDDCYASAQRRYHQSESLAIGGLMLMAGGIGRSVGLVVKGLQQPLN